MANSDGTKSGGRKAGTQNKATRELKSFLDGVFTEAFANPSFRVELLLQIVTLKLDPTLLRTLLAYWAGSVPKAVEHKHKGKLTLEQLVAGVKPEDVDDEVDE